MFESITINNDSTFTYTYTANTTTPLQKKYYYVPYLPYEETLTSGTQTIKKTSSDNSENDKLSPIDKKIKEQIEINKKEYGFIDIKEYVPNKVYQFTFFSIISLSSISVKTVCDDSDTFDLETAFYIALAKKLYPKQFTPEGYVKIAEDLKYEKHYAKLVKHGIKLLNLLKEKEEHDKAEEERKKLRHQKYVQKKIERKAKKKNELYNIIREAIEDAK